MSCSHCGNEKVFARGYCQGCYSRLRRRGTLARKNVVNRGECQIEGCERKAFSKNLCCLHYQRAQHPLTNVWKLLRSRAPGNYPPAWDIFGVFLEAVGEPPSPKHQFRRLDGEKPWGPGNFVWREPITSSWKNNRADYAKRWDLRKKYNLTLEQRDVMLEAQDFKCGICGIDLRGSDPSTGKPYKICVDHDHYTGKVRGILHDDCNKGIGMFQESLDIIRKAVKYLERHKEEA